jgi:anionic cell wall polymer biosynthesis LytR-Cps2A-Psr (LCP) family protein
MVNFEAFQQIVDTVGGVEVTLTEGEAHYLNTTNYISEKKYRNVVAGTQTLNGNQALGYSRVRKVATSTESNDFGRTQRQRIVLKAIYNKVKKKNIVDQALLMNKILTEIKPETDITKAEFRRYMEEAMALKVKDLQTLRIPTDGSYENVTRRLGTVNQEVLEPKDWNVTKAEIHDFIYGTSTGSETDADNQTATGASEDEDSAE